MLFLLLNTLLNMLLLLQFLNFKLLLNIPAYANLTPIINN